MSNPRISAKERNLIKGAIRRVFSRSDLRKAVIEASIIHGYTDPARPRVKAWCRCMICATPTAKSYMECDHILPIIPTDTTLELMSWDTVIDRIWCVKNNLQAICETCHDSKTKAENAERRRRRKEEKTNGTRT